MFEELDMLKRISNFPHNDKKTLTFSIRYALETVPSYNNLLLY